MSDLPKRLPAALDSMPLSACMWQELTASLLRFWSAATSGIQFLLAGGILDSSTWSWQWQCAEVCARAAYVTLVCRARTSHHVAARHRMQNIECNMTKCGICSHEISRHIVSEYSMLLWFRIIDHVASHYTNLILQHSIIFHFIRLCCVTLHCIALPRMNSFYPVTYHDMTLCQITRIHRVVAYYDTRSILLWYIVFLCIILEGIVAFVLNDSMLCWHISFHLSTLDMLQYILIICNVM